MFNPGCVWTVVLLGFCFADGSWGAFPAYTAIDCTTPTPFDYGSADEGHSGTLENIKTPAGESIALESPSCPVCLSFLDLSHTPGDAYATVNTKIPLNAEALTEYNGYLNYTVACKDSGVRNKRTVKLNDLNDNAPEFEEDVYRVQVSEFLSVESLVVQVKAIDADVSPDFNAVTYNINPPSDTFIVTSHGSVVLKKQLNYAVTRFYSFTVTAMDMGGLSGATTVEVNVTGEVDIHDVVKIAINKPSDVVMNHVYDTEIALERGLELLVMIRDVGCDIYCDAVVSFIARQSDTGSIVPPEDVKSDLRNNKQKVRTELQGVFGPDTVFWVVDDGQSSGSNRALSIGLGVGLPLAAIVLIGICMVMRGRSQGSGYESF